MTPYGICQRCGLRYYVTELKKEWTGLRVCPDDFDPRPAELKPPRYKPEGLIVPNASPEPAEAEAAPFDRIFDPLSFDTGEVLRSDL
jgi:hypothetical protein